jgi:hypothetical protein
VDEYSSIIERKKLLSEAVRHALAAAEIQGIARREKLKTLTLAKAVLDARADA